jgi:hypothetical protein
MSFFSTMVICGDEALRYEEVSSWRISLPVEAAYSGALDRPFSLRKVGKSLKGTLVVLFTVASTPPWSRELNNSASPTTVVLKRPPIKNPTFRSSVATESTVGSYHKFT